MSWRNQEEPPPKTFLPLVSVIRDDAGSGSKRKLSWVWQHLRDQGKRKGGDVSRVGVCLGFVRLTTRADGPLWGARAGSQMTSG